MTGDPDPWRTLSKRPLLERPPWLCLEEHRVGLPDGTEIPDWLWVDTPDFINVAAVDRRGGFLCFRQQKYAVEGITLGIVGGYLEPGEDPAEAAARELREETGYASERWTPLGSCAIDGNRGCGRGHLFLARDCEFRGEVDSDDLEDQRLVILSREEVLRALRNGDFGVMPWVAAMALALLER